MVGWAAHWTRATWLDCATSYNPECEVNRDQWPRLTSHLPQITLFVIITVSWGGGFELKGSFAVYVSVVDILIICACQVKDPWRHKSDLWGHRCDTASSISIISPKYSTEMHQNTSFCAELNGEHIGEGFMPLWIRVLLIWTREVEKPVKRLMWRLTSEA